MEILDLDHNNFESTVNKPGLVLVDCWASWCGPCRLFEPIFESAANKYTGCTFAKLDTEQNKDLISSLGIEHVPTLLLYREGILLLRKPGTVTFDNLEDFISQAEALDMDQIRSELAALEAANGTSEREVS